MFKVYYKRRIELCKIKKIGRSARGGHGSDSHCSGGAAGTIFAADSRGNATVLVNNSEVNWDHSEHADQQKNF